MYNYEKMKAEMFEGGNTSKYSKLYTIVVATCIKKKYIYNRRSIK